MEPDASRESYVRALEILCSCFKWRIEMMDQYETALEAGDGETLERTAESIEAVHQVQHRSFEMLQVMSRHFLHVLDADNSVELFNALSEEDIDPSDPERTLETIRSTASSAKLTSERSRQWLDEELTEIDDPSRAELLSLVIGGVMLMISENFHEVVETHQVLSDRMIELVHRARDGHSDLAVVPSDYIPVLNPGETARSMERTLREYTETYLDPDMDKAYR